MKIKIVIKRIKIIRDILIIAIFLFLCLLLHSVNWFLNTWDSSVDFSTVVYQLFSPLKGTGRDMMLSYMNSCVYPTALIMGSIIVIYIATYILKQKLLLIWDVKIGARIWHISSDCRLEKILNYMGLLSVFCIMCFMIYQKAVSMGVIDYIGQISKDSTIFDEEYVAPEEVTITFPEQKRNLILIYLESMEITFASMEAGDGKTENYIPELAELAADNISFSNNEGVGGAGAIDGAGWTMAALLASSAGVPYKLEITPNTEDSYENFLPGITTLGDILLSNGYNNYFICGSDISFAGRGDFYSQHGDYCLIDLNTARREGFVSNNYHNGSWGMEDEKLFALAKEKLSDIARQDEPFNFTLLTVDTHPQGYICGVCEDKYGNPYANVLACSSRQTYEFIEWIREQEWYADTTIIITGDHLCMQDGIFDDAGGTKEKYITVSSILQIIYCQSNQRTELLQL